MQRSFCIALSLCALLMMPSSAMAFEIPDVIIIKRPADLDAMTTWIQPVRFFHGMHAAKNACIACHHMETAEDMGNYVPCTDCHNLPGMLEPESFYAAWHAKSPISCVGCHWQKRLHKEANPPLSCTNSCHKKPQ